MGSYIWMFKKNKFHTNFFHRIRNMASLCLKFGKIASQEIKKKQSKFVLCEPKNLSFQEFFGISIAHISPMFHFYVFCSSIVCLVFVHIFKDLKSLK